jgi:magnesium transporter
MIRRVIAIPRTATVMDACDLFILHKFLAFPVVDDEQRIVGLVDVTVLTNEVFDVAKREQLDEVFQTIGFRVSQVRDASPVAPFASGFRGCWRPLGAERFARAGQAFEVTLAKSLCLPFSHPRIGVGRA